jgi:hypothetical protein
MRHERRRHPRRGRGARDAGQGQARLGLVGYLTALPTMDVVRAGYQKCKHIANAMLRARIEAICRAAGYEPPAAKGARGF